MPGPGPRAPCSPAPLRPLLLLLCALAPGAPGFASGGWPPRSPASARPLSAQTRCPPPPGCEDRSESPGSPELALRHRLCLRLGRSRSALAALGSPPRAQERAPLPGFLGRERLQRTRSIRAGVGCSPSFVRLGWKAGSRALPATGPARSSARPPPPCSQPPAPRLGTARGPSARGPASRGPALPASLFPGDEGAGAEREAGASSPPRPAGLG